MKLKLKKDIIENVKLNNEAIMTYVGIVASHIYGMNETLANKDIINFCLTRKHNATRRFEESIRLGLNQLIDSQIISCKDKIGINYYLDNNNIVLKKNDKFIFAELDDINKIMSSTVTSKSNILRLYLCILGTFINKNNIKDVRDQDKYNNILGSMSQDYLATISHLSRTSVVEYIKELEALKLLYVSRCSFTFKDKSGKVKKHNNIYGRYEDKELIDEFANVRYSIYDDLHKVQDANNINNARSLTQKYNHMLKGTKYDKGTVAAIYEYINNYNKKYPNKSKDISIFEEYGYKI